MIINQCDREKHLEKIRHNSLKLIIILNIYTYNKLIV